MILEDVIRHTPGWDKPGQQERIERARGDYTYFCTYYLPHVFTSPFCEYHKTAIAALNNKNYNRYVFVAPRDHGKTQLMYTAYNLWASLFGYEAYIANLASSYTMAVRQLRNVKLEFENNERILEDFGDVRSDNWKKDELELKNRTLILAAGANCSIRGLIKQGRRPSLINLDDLEKDITARSKLMRDQTEDWIKRVVIPLGKDARIFYTGTILGYDSVLQRFVNAYENNPKWFVRVFKALKKGSIDDLRKGTAIPLWPERWTLEKLQERLEEIGTAAFSTEYMNEPLSKEDMLFLPETFQFYEVHPSLDQLDIIMAIDPSTGKSHGDYQGLVTIGKDRKTGLIYVLDAVGLKVSDVKLVDEIIKRYLRWTPRKILFEDVAFQTIYKRLVAQTASAKGINLPLYGVSPKGRQKEVRIQSLQAPIENGVLLFHEKFKLLLSQLECFHPGMNNPDDLPDALAYAVEALSSSFIGGSRIGTVNHVPCVLERLGRWGKGLF
jgi:predicted phage terminase large subunit-like protein